jgi:polyphosphate glucokinase
VLGGGNAKHIKDLPPDTRMGDNRNAFVGGSRLWEKKTQPFGGSEEKPAAKKRR